ncbi:Uma2 family endonuclease [Spirosoma sp.]|uniref:Uma2 family endonuclease n=1 Tax=Spirosoma sp. TaxID=1899569 RepID=UPI00262BD1C0|nr:Uma2 family endonuclease [Spirosoma sp.]MCX6218120.1 Uma2 family endonuclease [Spirosoma sp.]
MEQVLRTIRPTRYREFDDAFFFDLCQANETTKLERDANRNIILIPHTGSETGHYNVDISGEIGIWSRRMKLSYVFDSSTGFKLPN